MSSALPVRIQVHKAVANAARLEGTLELSRLPRLQTFLIQPSGEGVVKLRFERGEDGRARLLGRIQAKLAVQCQRCLGEMHHALDADLDLILLTEGAGEDSFDGVDVSNDELLLHDLIEDEMILALPAVPMHGQTQDCEKGQAPQEYLQREKKGGRNPFAVLDQLKPNKPSTR